MRTLRMFAIALVPTLLLGACSVWQNASRKYLEKQAYDFAGLKLHDKLIGCAEPIEDSSWREESRDQRARVLSREAEQTFELRVEPTDQHGEMACDYRFANAEERAAVTDAAVAYSLDLRTAP